MEFLNRIKDKFEWEKDDIPTGEMMGEEEPFYLNLIAEISGVQLETVFEDKENTMQEIRAPSLADRAAAAAQNVNLFKTT